jgi:hypothetical protein
MQERGQTCNIYDIGKHIVTHSYTPSARALTTKSLLGNNSANGDYCLAVAATVMLAIVEEESNSSFCIQFMLRSYK